MLFIQEKFLSKDECNQLISLYNQNLNTTFQYEYTRPLSLVNIENDLITDINQSVYSICQFFYDRPLRLDNVQIVKWPKGAHQNPHYDSGDAFASIIYLNDNFIGGRTCFQLNDTMKVKPETGKCIVFSNAQYLHWVEEVQENVRYTLAHWFVANNL